MQASSKQADSAQTVPGAGIPRRHRRAIHAVCAAALVLAQFAAAPQARAENYGDWTVAVGERLRIAHTSNEIATVGFGCVGDADCFAYMSSRVAPCKEGESTAFLLNSAGGSASTRAVCKRINGELIDVFDDMEALNTIAFKDEVFRLVVPLANGAFQISSFSSRGAMAALRTLSTAQPGKEIDSADGLI